MDNGQITGVVLNASDKYYGQVPFVSQVVFRYYPTADLALAAYKAGEVLGISQVPSNLFASACSDPNLACYSSRMPRLSMVLFNLDNNDVPFFQDKNIRLALMAGLNRQWMVDNLLQGTGHCRQQPAPAAYLGLLRRCSADCI